MTDPTEGAQLPTAKIQRPNVLTQNASSSSLSPPHLQPVTIHAESSASGPTSPSGFLPRLPPQAHVAPEYHHHLPASSPSSKPEHRRSHSSIGGTQSISRPVSPAVSIRSGPSSGHHQHSQSVSVTSHLRDDGILQTPRSAMVHEDEPEDTQRQSMRLPLSPAKRVEGSPSPSRARKENQDASSFMLGSTVIHRSFSTATAPQPSPSSELNVALAEAQGDLIPTDVLQPHAEVSPPASIRGFGNRSASSAESNASVPSFWDSLFPVPTLLNGSKRSSASMSDKENTGPSNVNRRGRTLDSGTGSIFPSLPAWLSPAPSRTPSPPHHQQNGGPKRAYTSSASSIPGLPGSADVAPSEGNQSFLDTITRLRSLIGMSDSEAPGDWVRNHRAELDDVVRRAERDEALEMAKRRAEAMGRNRMGREGSGKFPTRYEEGPDGQITLITGEDEGRPTGKASEGDPEEQILRMQEEWISPKLPVVFCHGLFGFDVLGPRSVPALTINYWRGIIDILESNGTKVLVTRVPMSASIADRAAALKSQIEAEFPEGQEINLIGHSMGGLDCRYLISKLGLGPKEAGAGQDDDERSSSKVTVRSLTTIATPHRGSSFADYMLDEVIGSERLPFLLNALERIGMPGGGAAFENLTLRSMASFNSKVPDCEGVRYFSWGAAFNPGLLNEFRIPHGIIYAKEGANDGLVSVQSSMWGQYQGTLRNVSHLHLIGWISAAQNAWRDLVGRRRVLDPAAFYLQICEDLAKEGL
ncbi:lipase 2 [Tilletia horrida]|nr:lipase 2 [Tilletia horrida]